MIADVVVQTIEYLAYAVVLIFIACIGGIYLAKLVDSIGDWISSVK